MSTPFYCNGNAIRFAYLKRVTKSALAYFPPNNLQSMRCHLCAFFNAQSRTAVILFSVLNCVVTPYATSSPDWLERIVATHGHGYETLDDENVVSTSRRQPRYINIAADGSLDLPPNLRNIILEFELSYENTRYRRLQK